ncbi:ligase-associated DNA damage response exonuclease [Luteibacter sp. UNCMF366Tsu5.1]|uniref:ligase-associated DNA damage response exonuclease n=1 Tax=Luteibacter sp. UNCMF366Tsu5.1 TaxID=1502758 RepID=UPI0009089F0E|nr:ligase-associated DNA damage response exonuclease [Luteibacter sp. UNCMF366Tsu5.1]SFW19983.1 putative mRNA 3-end processing factor [Luteibacter sp. UNCMF366Tsu5.1]
MDSDLLLPRPEGLYCPAGDFFIDPMQPVARAVVTHAHGDHARSGSGLYHVAAAGEGLMRERLGAASVVHAHDWREAFDLGDTRVSFHPSGHILGAAQIRIEGCGKVAVVSGDYKRDPDPTCAPFEPVPCDVFVTESTFGLPIYRWPSMRQVVDEILGWVDECAARGVAAVLFCYALGKAQRLLAELATRSERAVHLHGAMLRLVALYREAGVHMLPTVPVSESARGKDFAGELVMAPPSAAGSPWMRRFGKASTGFASGWMQVRGARRRRGYDRGFVVSDHADWPGLLRSVADCGAKRIYVTHGDGEVLIRHLREHGREAFPLRSLGGQMPDLRSSEEGD